MYRSQTNINICVINLFIIYILDNNDNIQRILISVLIGISVYRFETNKNEEIIRKIQI